MLYLHTTELLWVYTVIILVYDASNSAIQTPVAYFPAE